jgi:hypothetical protein
LNAMDSRQTAATQYWLTFLTRVPPTSPETGRRFLYLFLNHFPTHVPEFFGNTTASSVFRPENLEAVAESWTKGRFVFVRHTPNVELRVHAWSLKSRDPRHSSITFFDFQCYEEDDRGKVYPFLQTAAELLDADYAVAHILTTTELTELRHLIAQKAESAEAAKRAEDRITWRLQREGLEPVLASLNGLLNLNTVTLRKFLLPLYWATVFGPPYIELFGRSKLLSVPAFDSREVSAQRIAVRLTDHLADDDSGWNQLKKARIACQQHLGRNSFWEPGSPPDRIFDRPYFSFPVEMYKLQ